MRLESVGKRYGPRQPWIVRDVSLDAAPGRLIRLEGRNGSGKSTLLRVVAGVSRPSRGKVTDRPHTGYVPERFPGALPFSGRDYLLHLARVHGLRGAGAARRVANEWAKLTATASHPKVLLAGLATALVCLLVASAVGALLNPPLLRHPGLAILSTLTAVIVALASDVSPAAAALRHSGTSSGPQWPGAVSVIAALCLAAVTWTASSLAAARRDNRSR